MSSYKDRYVEVKQSKDVIRLSSLVDELVTIIECYECVYDELKDVVDSNFIHKNQNKTVFLKDIVANTNNGKRDITIIKRS